MSRIAGNRALCDKLCENIITDKLSHAFIIEGSRGTGKHTLALNIAAALACRHRTDGENIPCYECTECRKIFSHISPDIISVGRENGKATLGVDAIRFLKTDVHTVPNDLDFKLYIIEDADKMTKEAQNAFLLTLEEPPSFVKFVLLCESAEALLETIRSRAPILRMDSVSCEDIDRYICEVDRRAAQMKLTSPAEYTELIRAAKHGIGTALEYLDPKVFAPVKETRAIAYDFCDAATSGEGARRIFPIIDRFSDKRAILAEQLATLNEALTDLVMLKKSDSITLEFFSSRERAIEMCDRASIKILYDLNTAVLTACESIQRNANVRLTLLKLLSDANII